MFWLPQARLEMSRDTMKNNLKLYPNNQPSAKDVRLRSHGNLYEKVQQDLKVMKQI